MDFIIAGSYRSEALMTYGSKCEWIGCKWNAASCDVHHIDYQEQQQAEKSFRQMLSKEEVGSAEWTRLAVVSKENGWGEFDLKTRQLEKNDDSKNLAVLCPNHHRYLHQFDLGIKALTYLPERV